MSTTQANEQDLNSGEWCVSGIEIGDCGFHIAENKWEYQLILGGPTAVWKACGLEVYQLVAFYQSRKSRTKIISNTAARIYEPLKPGRCT
jgi:hypothetical protein